MARAGDDPRRPKPPTSDLVRPGGKVDREALRRAVHRATPPEDPDDPDAPELLQPADDDAPNRVVFTLQRDLQKRLDKYLTDRIPFMSRTQLQRLIDAGEVTVNGRKPKPSTVLRLGDTIQVFIPPPPATDVPPQDIPLDVLYEDAHIIVLNKRPDIIVHPARSHLAGTLINALAYHFQHRSGSGGGLSTVGKEFARPGVVHRLDRNTSGVIVFAKDDEAHWKLALQFERRTVDKRYVAIVHGRVEPLIDVIDLPLGPHPSREKGYREKYVVRHDHLGKPAVTIYRVLGRYSASGPGFQPVPPSSPHPSTSPPTPAPGWAPPPSVPAPPSPPPPRADSDDYSLIEVELKTGRTHQIRVHFSHLGYPLVGDDMYGGRPAPPDLGGLARQALHAATLSFRHPITDEPMSFTAPLPADLARLTRALRALPHVHEPADIPGATLSVDALLAGAAE